MEYSELNLETITEAIKGIFSSPNSSERALKLYSGVGGKDLFRITKMVS